MALSRVFVGFLLAPLSSALAQAIIAGRPLTFVPVAIAAYLFAIFLGLPTWLLFRRFGWQAWWQVVGVGVALGVLAGFVFHLSFGRGLDGADLELLPATLLGFCGHAALVATIFWLIAIRKPALSE